MQHSRPCVTTPATAGGCSTNSLEAEAESAALDDYDDDNDVCRIIRRINENNIKADNPILLVTFWLCSLN